ncbi:MAG: hypothetical protein ACXAC5_07625 [Promethearchaeota archaeon]|jgi:hypothetical protein
MEFFITLTFFDTKIGPSVFYSYPISDIEKDLVESIASIMDLVITEQIEQFVTYSFDKYYSLNYYFEIDSTWARGFKDALLLSAIFDVRVSFEIEKAILTLCIEFSEWLKKQKDIFKGFYTKDSFYYKNQKDIIDENSSDIRTWVEEFYEAISEVVQEKTVEDNITSFIEEENVLKTLKLLIFGPMNYEKLREWYSSKFPETNFTNLLIKLIKYHMIIIPNVGKSKKPPFTVYIAEDIKRIINLIDLKNRLLKRFIKKRQKESSEVIEKRSKELEEILEKTFL